MNININSSATDITQVTVDGNTDIQKVNVNGTDVWFKAPTATEAAQGLYDNWNLFIRGQWGTSTSSLGSLRKTKSNIAGDGGVGTHTETFSGYSLSSVSSPLSTSPTTTAVFMQYGDDAPSTISTLKVNNTTITEEDSYESASYGHNTDGQDYKGQLAVSLGHSTTQLKDVTSTQASFGGGGHTQNATKPSYSHSMVLPGEWNIDRSVSGTLTNNGDGGGDNYTYTATTTLAPNEIAIIARNEFGNVGANSAYVSADVTTSASQVFERLGWYYAETSLSMWVNNSSSNENITISHNGLSNPAIIYSDIVVLQYTGI